MGSFLSGRSGSRNGKTLVEHCFTLNVGRLLHDGHLWDGAQGAMSWSHGYTGERLASVGFSVVGDDEDGLTLRLRYRTGDNDDIDLPVGLQTTFPNYGGIRWWLTCPLMNGDRPCKRRVAKLHLRSRYFGCRQCLNLAYYSSQSAHLQDRAIASVARMAEQFKARCRREGFPDLDLDRLFPASAGTTEH